MIHITTILLTEIVSIKLNHVMNSLAASAMYRDVDVVCVMWHGDNAKQVVLRANKNWDKRYNLFKRKT